MTRDMLEKYISEEYGAACEHLWAKYPDYEVFRHGENKKWFAILMNVPEDKLRKPVSDGAVPKVLDILDVKCEPFLAGFLRTENGFFPAYHMNKGSWISMDIEQVDDEKMKSLLDMSYELTAPKAKKKGSGLHGTQSKSDVFR